jgi:hypothetical protein
MRARVAMIVFAAALACAGSASAQLRGGTVEINGFAGYLFGGGLGHGPVDVNYPYSYHIDIADDANYGGRIGYNLNSTFEFEFEFAQTDTSFIRHADHANIPDQRFADLNIQYFMGYMTFNFGRGRGVPYFTIGGGVANFDPRFAGNNAGTESRGTMAVGGGYKYFFTPHFALRADGRLYSSYIGSSTFVCGPYTHCTQTTWVTNFATTGGFIVAF